MLFSERRAMREYRAQKERAAAELLALYGALHEAYACFERTADPALTDACVLQIGALKARCGALLRALKELESRKPGGMDRAVIDRDPARRRRRAAGAAAEASEKAHQMGL